MKTINYVNAMINANLEGYRTTRKNLAAARDTLVTLYKETSTGKPADTVKAFVSAVGYDLAAVVIASMVNHAAWDGRIFESVKTWAASVENSYNEEAAYKLGLYSDSIHKAHLNQLGEAMRDYTLEEPTPEVDEEPAKEDTKEAGTMFNHLRAAIADKAADEAVDALFFIQNGYKSTWAAEYRTDADRGLREYLTKTRWNAYQGGQLTREKAVEIAKGRAIKKIEKEVAAKIAKLDAAEAAPALSYLSISVEWKRSKTWGANPTAESRSNYAVGTGTASGCGYDKESAAIAEALNSDPAVMRELYAVADRALMEGKAYRDYIGYGSGYSIIPYFEGGVGSNCFWSIFEKMGFDVRRVGSGKMYDCWTVERKAA